MSRLNTPSTVESAPEASRPSLNAVAKSLGSVPNLFRLLGTSPPPLKGYCTSSRRMSGLEVFIRSKS